MLPRLINPLKTNSFFLFGARGVGKSLFIQKQFSPDDALMIDLLDPDQEEAYLKKPKLLENQIAARNPEWVVIDEVQRAPKLLNLAHRLIERSSQKFILLGSSARKLKRGLGNMLAGRAFMHELYPLTTYELGELFSIEEVCNWGSLPKLNSFTTDLEKKRYLRSYVQTYVKEEIQQEQIVRNLDPFRFFLEVAAQMSGKILNSSAIGREVGCEVKTVQNYFSILESTYLGFFLPAFHRSVRKSQRVSPKFFLFDLGVKRSLEQGLDSHVSRGTSYFGDLFEHWVIQEIYRLNSYREADWKLSFFSTGKDREIDLVLSKGKKNILLEIKSSKNIDEVEVRKLARLAKDFPGESQVFYLSENTEEIEIEGIRCVEWRKWIGEFFHLPNLKNPETPVKKLSGLDAPSGTVNEMKSESIKGRFS